MQATISNTKFVRTLMQKHGKSAGRIFTNKYATCRTVKCYGDATETGTMVKDILTQLREMGIAATAKYTKKQHCYSAPATIIRLPL